MMLNKKEITRLLNEKPKPRVEGEGDMFFSDFNLEEWSDQEIRFQREQWTHNLLNEDLDIYGIF